MEQRVDTQKSSQSSRLRRIISELWYHSGEKYIYDFQHDKSGKISFACSFPESGQVSTLRVDLITLIADPDTDFDISHWAELPRYCTITSQSMKRAYHSGISASEIVDYLSARMIKMQGSYLESALVSMRSWQAFGTSADRTASSPELAINPSQHESQLPSLFQMPRLPNSELPSVLESAVSIGDQMLGKLRKLFADNPEVVRDSAHWLELMKRVQSKAAKSKTVIGVLGATGSGKSSIINALLEEEQLLPTSCMRACTAVITEISYNDRFMPYRAEVEFISAGEWKSELQVLFQDLVDESSGTVFAGARLEGDTEAGVAYAKLKAVFPELTKETMSMCTVESLMTHPNLSLLGKTHKIEAHDAATFHRLLKKFIDSKEKIEERDWTKKKEEGEWKKPSHWPLIRVVRIYTKSEVLKTGAILVDLPGVQDSNTARALIADKYISQCTGLWIVAPITRAVDDKTAKCLLGKSFRRQLKMDGGIGAVSFICSKTDDISIMEASDSLGLQDELGEYHTCRNQLRNQLGHLDKELSALALSCKDAQKASNEAFKNMTVWEGVKKKITKGTLVYPPTERGSRNRKSNLAVTSPEPQPVKMAQAEYKIAEFKEIAASAANSRELLEEELENIEEERQRLLETFDNINSRIHETCVNRRNLYTRSAVRQDFANGVREVDQDIAADEDGDHFDPNQETRDYTQVERRLPVFEVSSRAYQKIRGRFDDEVDVLGFASPEDTQIPQLQRHCIEITVENRINVCKGFWAALSQLLISLSIWAANGNGHVGTAMTNEERSTRERHTKDHLSLLETDLHAQIRETRDALTSIIEENIIDHFGKAIALAAKEATDTAAKWGARVNYSNRSDGGLHYMTYKAICRRHGSGLREYDWNSELCHPVIRKIATGWETAFNRQITPLLRTFADRSMNFLQHFHHTVIQTAYSDKPGILLLNQQLATYERMLDSVIESIRKHITTQQKDINRQFAPVVKDAMSKAYAECTAEFGIGSFARMKSHLQSHIDETANSMFQNSTKKVEQLLQQLVCAVQEKMESESFEIFHMVERDYLAVLTGDVSHLLTASEKEMRGKVLRMLKESEQSLCVELDPQLSGPAIEDLMLLDGRYGHGEDNEEDQNESDEETNEESDEDMDGVESGDSDERHTEDEAQKETEENEASIRTVPSGTSAVWRRGAVSNRLVLFVSR